ncbi:methyl-accepting chemotaxis protein [Rhizobium sp. NFR07]|uniref:methyl-accepting chemotaxis protein n=1 Tax=Rhizobium sp. NFR07 TaxID=1566262 RepID=UPI0008F417A6|nr:methyl-accepting chemotaxis protein [Rhizobium sp. NFR07]SFB53017.1 methyl-accepting chemotaxis protein [Rhizobium sp. NFR07]
MNALETIRQKASMGIVTLLWINVALIIARNFYLPDGMDISAMVAAVVIGGMGTLLWLNDRTGATTRVVTSMAHAAQVGILVFLFSGSPLQIDVHMYFFASLAMCAVWVDRRAIFAYASFVIVHHLLLFLFASAAVFPGQSSSMRVVLHAIIVIVIGQAGVLLALIKALTDTLVSAQSATDKAQAAQQATDEMSKQAREADQRMDADRQRARSEAEIAAQQRLRQATDGLGRGLRQLANGDLTVQLDEPFSEEFEALRHDLNAAVRQLRDTLNAVAESVTVIDDSSKELSRSANDLARRTEQQAATLEETAASLGTVTGNIHDASKRTQDARGVAADAASSTVNSATIVASAVDAMSKIEGSSAQVSTIIGVIDQIAFQTNLLALNAGVEAARAGEAGKGFAVVAQEVRDLAQRSADAAGQIKELIRLSGVEVENGVGLVRETGDALKAIEGYIVDVNRHMEMIASTTREQSSVLGEVNSAVGQMDKATQQNAAMVEETSAAVSLLTEETTKLSTLISRFTLGGRQGAYASQAHSYGRAA